MPTVASAVALFMSAIYGEVADATQLQYQFAVRLLEPIRPMELTAVTVHELRTLRAGLVERYAPASVNTICRVWRVFLNWCVLEGMLTISPYQRIRPLKEPQQMKSASLEDVSRMIVAAHQSRHLRDEAIMLLMLSTGCRVGAVCKLCLNDIHYEALTATLLEKGNHWHTVNLLPHVSRVITDYIDYERPATTTNPLLFLSYRNPDNGLTPNAILYMLRRYANELGITSPVNPHAFRHCYTVTMLRNGASLDVVSKLLGHSSVAVTEKYYAKWDSETLRDVNARLNPVVNMNKR